MVIGNHYYFKYYFAEKNVFKIQYLFCMYILDSPIKIIK